MRSTRPVALLAASTLAVSSLLAGTARADLTGCTPAPGDASFASGAIGTGAAPRLPLCFVQSSPATTHRGLLRLPVTHPVGLMIVSHGTTTGTGGTVTR